jgi:DnaJ-class molecular chaperone
MITQGKCRSCKGLGIDESVDKCKKCKGQKFYKEKVELQVEIPKGSFHKFPVVMEEQGHQVPPDEVDRVGKSRSDAIFVIVEKPHDLFKRRVVIPEKRCIDQSDLSTEIVISFADSLTGFSTILTHLDNEKLVIEYPKMCRHGDTFVLIGGGMPKLNDSDEKHGDLFVRIVVQHPEEAGFSDETKKQLLKLLTGKTKMTKINNKNSSAEFVPLEKYIANIKIQADSDSLKEEYKHRRNTNGRHNTDDDDENMHGHRGQMGGGMPPQCTQQ